MAQSDVAQGHDPDPKEDRKMKDEDKAHVAKSKLRDAQKDPKEK